MMGLSLGSLKSWFKPDVLVVLFSIALLVTVSVPFLNNNNDPPPPPSDNQTQGSIEPQAPEFVVPEVSTTLLAIVPMMGALFLSRLRNK